MTDYSLDAYLDIQNKLSKTGNETMIREGMRRLKTILQSGAEGAMSHCPFSRLSAAMVDRINTDEGPILDEELDLIYTMTQANTAFIESLNTNQICQALRRVLINRKYSDAALDPLMRILFELGSAEQSTNFYREIPFQIVITLYSDLPIPLRSVYHHLMSLASGRLPNVTTNNIFGILKVCNIDPSHASATSLFNFVKKPMTILSSVEHPIDEVLQEMLALISICDSRVVIFLECMQSLITKFPNLVPSVNIFSQFNLLEFVHKASVKVSISILHIIEDYLPAPPYNGNAIYQKNDFIREYVEQLQEDLQQIIIQRHCVSPLAMTCLARSISVRKFEPSLELLKSLRFFLYTPEIKKDALVICLSSSYPNRVSIAGLLPLFAYRDEGDEFININLEMLFARIGPAASFDYDIRAFSSFEDVLNSFDEEKFIFCIDTIIDFIKSPSLKCSNKEGLQRLLNLCLHILSVVPLPEVNGNNVDNVGQIFNETATVTIVQNGSSTTYDTSKESSFVSFEYLLNNDLPVNRPLPGLFVYEMTYPANTKKGAILRYTHPMNHYVYGFESNGVIYSPYETVYASMLRSGSNIFTAKCGNYGRTELPKSNLCVSPFINNVLYIVSRIHDIAPTLNFVDENLVSSVVGQIKSIAKIVGFQLPGVKLIYNFPYLFDFQTKYHLFKILAFAIADGWKAYEYFSGFMLDDSASPPPSVKFTVHREKVFEEGQKILQAFGPGNLHFDIEFIGEKGVGQGLSKEFFALMSHEFCKVDRKLWRTDSEDSEFVKNKLGLFPAPDADKDLMYLFGMFCGKAIVSMYPLDIPFNPAFFKLMKGENVTLEEVDPDLAFSLKDKKGLVDLPFLLPGYPKVQLAAQFENITMSNVNVFVSNVIDATVGSGLKEIMDAFRAGLNVTLDFACFRLLTPEEICKVISGEKAKFTIEELENYVIISHGYEPDSPQIKWLFEVLSEFDENEIGLFLKFVTASPLQPIGGLRKLRPSLTVAQRAVDDNENPDQSLPTAMTCTNYFKLPPYSSKQILKEKLLLAIHEGQNAFLLT